jgi:hypothetical protein
MKNLFISFVISCFALNGYTQTKQVVASSGSSSQSGDTFLEWTLGEPVTATFSSGNVMLTQGFQQPELTVTAIKTNNDLLFIIEAYPNPTGDLLMIQIGNSEFRDFQYVLYDMNGKVLDKKELAGTVTGIAMNNHPAGVYLLKIIQADKEIKMFEIVKNQISRP